MASDRGRRRRARPEGRRVGRDAGGGQDGPGADRAGGTAGGAPEPGRGWDDEARLLPVERPARDTAGGAGAGRAGGPSGRGVPAAGQERGGAGRVSSADVVGV